MGSSPSSPPGCHFKRRMAVIWPPRTEVITIILHVFRYKRAFTAILPTAPWAPWELGGRFLLPFSEEEASLLLGVNQC